MKLITEQSWDLKLYESKDDKSMKIVGIFSTAGIENNNKRKYKKELLEREVDKLTEKVKNKNAFGELSHPSSPEINPDRISHIIENLEWKGSNLFGKARLLNTPMGKIAKELVKEGNIGISSRGLGTVSEDGYVNDDYKLLTYDIVTDASNPGSKFVNGIYEGEQFYVPGEKTQINEKMIKEAKEQHTKKIWQVLKNIEKSL
jgi:hypothetical protein